MRVGLRSNGWKGREYGNLSSEKCCSADFASAESLSFDFVGISGVSGTSCVT